MKNLQNPFIRQIVSEIDRYVELLVGFVPTCIVISTVHHPSRFRLISERCGCQKVTVERFESMDIAYRKLLLYFIERFRFRTFPTGVNLNILLIKWKTLFLCIKLLKKICYQIPKISNLLLKCRKRQGGVRSLDRGFAPGPHWGLCPQTPYRLALIALAIMSQLRHFRIYYYTAAQMRWRTSTRVAREATFCRTRDLNVSLGLRLDG